MFSLGQEADDAQEVRAEAVLRVEVVPAMADVTQVVAFVSGDERLAAGRELCPQPGLGREEGVLAEEQIVRDDQSAVQQWAEGVEPREEEEEGLQGELVAPGQDVVQWEGVVQAVGTVAGYDLFLAVDEVFPDLEVGRHEEVMSEELLVEEEDHEFVQGPDGEEEWQEEEEEDEEEEQQEEEEDERSLPQSTRRRKRHDWRSGEVFGKQSPSKRRNQKSR